jgi:hypothetical protein
MKTSSRLALVFLTCTSTSVFAQDGSPNCVVTNFDSAQNMFTVVNPAPNSLNQQCFLTIHPASAAASGPGSQFVEGSYEILLSGGGGGGGGGGGSEGRKIRGQGGQGGAGAVPVRTVTNLAPGVYRLTLGTGGRGGGSCVMARETATNAVFVEPTPGTNGFNGNPTGLAEAYSGKTIAGFPRAENWAGTESYEVATGRRVPVAGPSSAVSDRNAPGAINGSDGMSREDGPCEPGFAGGHGFIKMTLLAQAAPPPQAAPAPVVVEPAPAPKPITRPRKDRN